MELDPVIEALVLARKLQHLTQQDVADAAGFKQSQLSEWENGINVPTLTSLRRWATALGLNVLVRRES